MRSSSYVSDTKRGSGHAATFRLNRDHSLAVPLERLFGAERAANRVTRRERLEQRRLQREEIREHQEML